MRKNCMRSIAALSVAVTMLGMGMNVSAADEGLDKYVRMNVDVTYDMSDADYWINNYQGSIPADKVLHSQKKIAEINENNKNSITVGECTVSLFDIEDDTLDGSIVKALIDDEPYIPDPADCYLNGHTTTAEYWDSLRKKENAENIPDKVRVRYGFSTERSSLRTFPSYDFIGEDKEDRFYDVLVSSEYLPFRPLAVLHETADGNWYYVLFEGYAGWVHKNYVALCDSKEEWLERQSPDDFLIVTGREIRLQDDEWCRELSGQLLPMGTKLPLVPVSEAPEFINDRETTGCYIVKLPVRGEDGNIVDKYSLISITEDVHIGYLDYTSENLIRQSFKRFGDRYGWAGLGHSNDCSGITGEIYRWFGIELPRASSQLAAFEGQKTFDVTEYSDKQKVDLLKKLPAGSILFFKGHIMIYIGVVDDTPYCISATGTYCDADGNKLDSNSVIVTNMKKTYRADGETWLSHISKVVIV